ncbi:MAG: IS66 family insertion sequence element accessory protein TnpB [Pseudomonadales bacterium]|nr:IS66 family insertion sequence element accessory protein TnpB [Pseudomonadales bacterium]
MMRPDAGLPRVYLCVAPVDFRKSIDGLSLLVEQQLYLSPFEAVLFVFINRRRDKIKILYWEKNGFCLWYKRLEKQHFKWPDQVTATIMLNGEQLNWLLDGFDLWRNKPFDSLHFDSVG